MREFPKAVLAWGLCSGYHSIRFSAFKSSHFSWRRTPKLGTRERTLGTFTYEITLISSPESDSEMLTARVDTGATFTSVPGPILERLGVTPQRRVRLRLANGEVVEQQIGEVLAEMDGVRATIICIFGPADAPPLIGAHTLEAFLLAVDPVAQRLVPVEALWIHCQS